ncbi:MAG: DNA primase [Treponema sp.]|nr:DNA primase [Treponema sp.]
MALISKTTIDEINTRMDAVATVNDYVRMEKKGGRWWGLCPFHNEKTPSFTVNPDLKSYYCFGCHKGGSVLNFVMDMDKLTFPEAVEQLAKRIGVEIQYENSGAAFDTEKNEIAEKKDTLFELYRRMAGTFHHLLLNNSESITVKHYIKDRGLTEQMIEKFNLGYAPADRRWMHKFLLQKGYSADFLAGCGLFSARHPGMPLFSNRLMFPIKDRQGRVVAFGGRITGNADPGTPKYINSPELETYKKGESLYAIDLALPEIRKTGIVHLAEGYMDVIALHQAGITNSVASLGTAFTDEQARLLKRWAEKAVLVFDTDEAGLNAAVKGIMTCRKNGLACAVSAYKDPSGDNAKDPSGPKDPSDPSDSRNPKDPADILKAYGPDILQKRIKSYINDFDFLISRAKSLFDTRDSGGKSRAVAFLFPYLQALESDVTRDACIETAAVSFGTTATAIINDLKHNNTGIQRNSHNQEENQERKTGKINAPISMNDELFLLLTVAVNDFSGSGVHFYTEFRKKLAIKEIEDPYAKEIFIALEECFIYNETGFDNFLSRISSAELKKFCLEKSASEEFTINPQQIIADGLKKAEKKNLEKQLDEIVLRLKAIKFNPGSGEDMEKLLADKIHIDNKLLKLKEEYQ